ncbi:leucine-rich repeat-containing 15 [Brachionus plicatilis]|uniref:Leucine-rich repeat-containing 15 n=1 Tax=Brachionus plicatilis TaxID=10195 RepID=A0A3M7SYQ6_BRAPC|nr:leucine-rich repeat-containing 15 [Brachionus plicatilis]
MKKLQDLERSELLKHYDQIINDIDIKTETHLGNAVNPCVKFINDRHDLNHVEKLVIIPNYLDHEQIQILNSLIRAKLTKRHTFLKLNKDILQLCLIAQYFIKNCGYLDVMEWSKMKKYENLKLNSIQIKKIDLKILAEYLIELNNIEVVNMDFSCSSIESIESWSSIDIKYRCLKRLDLSNNNIKILNENIFDSLECLEFLRISDNKIELIDPGCFSELKNLKMLDLRNNFLSSINFKGTNSLKFLDLSENFIKNLEKNFFTNFRDLEILNLNSNRLNKIDRQLFFHLENLQELNLRKNLIVQLEKECFDCLKNLKKFDLGLNDIRLIKARMFRHLSKLNSLILDGNHDLELEENFFHKVSNLKLKCFEILIQILGE